MANDFNLLEYYEWIEKGITEDDIQNLTSQSIQLVGWYDHLAEFADVKAEKEMGKDPDGNPLYKHIRFDGNIVQQGTPVNAENLGQMEWNDLINDLKIQKMMDIIRALQVQVATLIGQNNNNMPYNSFVASAKNIDTEITIVEGWYDEANGRGVV